MGKTVKKKSYTEDVVLNKILQDIADENLQDNSSNPSTQVNHKSTYEDNLIKQYREKDALERRKKYFNAIKTFIIVFILITLVVFFINYIDTITKEEAPVKKTVIPIPLTKSNIKKRDEPIETTETKTDIIKISPVKKEEQKTITQPEPVQKAAKKLKTEREIAKEMLLQQMQNQ